MKEPKIIKWKKRRGTNSIFINKSSQPKLIYPKLQEVEVAPPDLEKKAVQAPCERDTDTTAMGCPNSQILHLPLPELLAHKQVPERGFLSSCKSSTKCQDRHQHCCPSATGTVLVKQLKTETTFLSFYIALLFSEEHSLPSF